MTQKGLFVFAAVSLFSIASAGRALGDVRIETSDRRPYVVEIGEPYSISFSTLQREAANIEELREYMRDYGSPDYAEIQEIEPDWPWESYEVRLFYLRRNLETDFGHVIFSSAMPDLGVLKFQGDIPPDKRHEIEVVLQAREAPPPAPAPAAEEPSAPAAAPPEPEGAEEGLTGDVIERLVQRIEAAAERASQAADRAVEQSEAAVRAADRTVSIVDKLEQQAAK
jgi:hypothetical protein